MGLLDLFLNRNKKSFKLYKKTKEQRVSTDDIQKLLENSNDPVVEMFKQIERYKNLKREILERSNIEELDMPQSEVLSIINEYMVETIEQIPKGIVIPIETNFKINDKKQSLLIGKELMCVGKFYIDNGEKLKRGIKKQDRLALFIDSSNIDNHKDFNKNIRIHVENNGINFINLIEDVFLEENWNTCRFSTVELNFSDEYEHAPIEQLVDTETAIRLFKYLPTLEDEMANSISAFLKEKANYFSETLKMNTENKKEYSTISESSINPNEDKNTINNTIKDNVANTNTEEL